MVLCRTGLSVARRVTPRVLGNRKFGHDAAEAAAEMEQWKRYSFAAIAVTSAFGAYITYVEMQHAKHPHEHEKIEYSHMKIRNKPYPWKCPDCNLLDTKCWAECKAALAEKGL
ncbi:hypothetical protein CTAYLR_007863 [Chrysophaeum taylorii]|uniref:Uncharacterized protein n=1 Tax=Chrysophaeum taylorii TaxID=2483200 RepID=A0AAD7UDH5_9STRA|nr:hypothetical protein CTAYLR_007863 [Chrysophaeum taylorii]